MGPSVEDDKVDLNHLPWGLQDWQLYSSRQSRLTTMNDSNHDHLYNISHSSDTALLSNTAGFNQGMNLCDTARRNWGALSNPDPIDMCSPDSAPRVLSTQRLNQDSRSLPTISPFNLAESDQISTSTTSDNSCRYNSLTELNAFDGTWSDIYNSSDGMTSFNPFLAEHQVNQDESYMQSSMLSQNSNYPSSKHRNRVSCHYAGCSGSFKQKTDLDRHIHTVHEDGGIICGDCGNTNCHSSRKRRSDHFLRHLLTEHGVAGATQKSILTCPLESCRPRNPSQQLCFSAQESLKLHLQKAHGIDSQGSRNVLLDQLLSPPSRGPAGTSGSLTNTKRPWEHNSLRASKRRRSAPSTVLSPGLDKENKTKGDGTNSLDISTDISALLCETPDLETESALTCYVDDISPYDFMKAKSLWHQVAKLVHEDFLVSGIPYLSFDARRRQIKVCLRSDFARKTIKDSIVKGLTDRKAVAEQASIEERQYIHTNFCPLKPPRAKVSDSAKVFPIRKTEDSEVINLWNKYIIPALFNILSEYVGDDYTASLVRAGDSPESADPVIHIESPHLPGPATQVDIRGQLDKACGRSLREARIEVQFFEESLILLAGEIRRDPKSSVGPKRSLPFYTRFWKHAGMGASIGLLCTATEFATLGCYLIVDGEKYILTVDHFISKSYGSRATDYQNDTNTLTSPAVAKVNRITKDLQLFEKHLEAELRAELSQTFPNGLQPEDTENPSRQILGLMWKLGEVQTWLQEHKKDDNANFKIGCLSFRCEEGVLAPLSSSHSMVNPNTSDYLSGIDTGHRLDWALFRVDPNDSRKGKNRYRYLNDKFHPEGEKIDEGEGDICHQTRVVEGGESVRFVGAGIGPHDGEVNAALQVVSQAGCKTLEHQIIMHAEYAKPASEYAGASGAVVLKLPDNEMLGLLWGCSKYPTFTPIRTVFADISRVTQAQEVELHRDSEAATPRMPSISASANEALLISGSELDALELRPYQSEDMVPPSMTSELKAKISKRLTALLRATPSKYPQSNTTTDIVDESRTATPSLSSSRASSPGVLPSTPNEQSNEVLSISESTQQLVLVVGEDIETVSGSNVEDGDTFEGSPFNQLLRNESAIPRAFSIPPIIGDGRQMPKEHLFSPQPSRRWNTWPFRSEDWSVSMERHNQLEVIIQ